MEQIIKDKINELVKNPTVTDEKLKKFLRESAREKIVTKLVWLVGLMYGLFLVTGAVLLFFSKIQFRDMLDLVLVLGFLAGFLGTAINFYFKD